MSEPLKIELETFENIKGTLLSQEGKFAVVYGSELLGVFDTYEDALKIGYDRCNLKPFLVKRIQAIEPVNYFFHNIFDICPT
jgi:hypothetical protein